MRARFQLIDGRGRLPQRDMAAAVAEPAPAPPPLRVAAAQFENASGDKAANLRVIERLAARAAAAGAQVVVFHELCVTGYTFLKDLPRDAVAALAEPVPGGPSTDALVEVSRRHGLAVGAGLVEVDPATGKLYNTYVVVDAAAGGFVARHRKLHVFISPHLAPGEGYTVFVLRGWRAAVLTCYDNLVVENVRAVKLLGAQVLLAPHVTGCTPSPGRAGAGWVDPALWAARHADPVPLRLEFDGPKYRRWLDRWLPANAFLNGLPIVYANALGMDGDQLKPGGAILLDAFGEALADLVSFEADVAVATLHGEQLAACGGARYVRARRPELYRSVLGADHASVTKPVWLAQAAAGAGAGASGPA